MGWINVPAGTDYVLRNAHVPECVIKGSGELISDRDGLVFVDIEIRGGHIASITPVEDRAPSDLAEVDLDGGSGSSGVVCSLVVSWDRHVFCGVTTGFSQFNHRLRIKLLKAMTREFVWFTCV